MIKIELTDDSNVEMFCKGKKLDIAGECATIVDMAIRQMAEMAGDGMVRVTIRKLYENYVKNPVTVGVDDGEPMEG